MSKGPERLADHVRSITETVIFLIEGANVRHRRLRQQPEDPARGAPAV